MARPLEGKEGGRGEGREGGKEGQEVSFILLIFEGPVELVDNVGVRNGTAAGGEGGREGGRAGGRVSSNAITTSILQERRVLEKAKGKQMSLLAWRKEGWKHGRRVGGSDIRGREGGREGEGGFRTFRSR